MELTLIHMQINLLLGNFFHIHNLKITNIFNRMIGIITAFKNYEKRRFVLKTVPLY